MIKNCSIEKYTKVYEPVNLYNCEIGECCKIATFVEIQEGAKIGNNVVVSSHSFICSAVVVEDDVFIGHGVMTTNDRNPRPNFPDYKQEKTVIKRGATIGSGVTLLPVTIGCYAIIGAGSVVTKNIPDYAIAYGNPAKVVKILTKKEWKKRMGL